MTLNVVVLSRNGETWAFVYDDGSVDEARLALWDSGLSSDDVLRLRERMVRLTEDVQ